LLLNGKVIVYNLPYFSYTSRWQQAEETEREALKKYENTE
jgi:hypothetical protein